ncbi:monofunctional biosynthetic peptidoglycan transglycosylase [Ohtaekwangia koreensis]|uniref:Biosynthetic peptidoglycan transglycosylase n=1 Tax=Ohtaekwangia koreensis TaxID=688867 RepID=A0A1T5MDD1_9BACT|nr:monofunctional biosynthetic peptidoglycan transglycosylase [Ohtaekwangia koreensis]SKC86247.1 monofunctional biosynthetic peptidoglycan transglycosylase [Ohtaekwangia koreensis]
MNFKKTGHILKKAFVILFFAHLLYIVILKWVDPPITITQFVSWVSGNGLKRDYVRWKDISSNAPLAIMSSEDQLFPVHNGFDWKSIEKAIEYNDRKKASIVRGGSTISQQVAKNVFLWQGRSWTRKGLEAYFTFMIEKIWGKKRILEVYMNVAEMGIGTFGIEAASRRYFKKSCKYLTQREASLIAANLPNPKKYKVNPPSSYMERRSAWIITQMVYLRNDDDIDMLLKGKSLKKEKGYSH